MKLLQAIGAKAYRFSVAWPRIFPTGTGQPVSKGLDFYSRLTDELLASTSSRSPRFYHWDLPQALQDKRLTVPRHDQSIRRLFGLMVERLSDRIKHFFTINEFLLVADAGYRRIDLVVGGKTVKD